MNVHLLFPDRDFDWSAAAPWNADILDSDLALDVLFDTMAQGDGIILQSVQRVVHGSLAGRVDVILHRQQILQDCLKHPAFFREIFAIANEAMEKEKKHYLGGLARRPHWLLSDAVDQIEMFSTLLRQLRSLADARGAKLLSQGMQAFTGMLQRELNDAFFARTAEHLYQLRRHDAILLNAGIGAFNRPSNYVLHRAPVVGFTSWWQAIWRWVFTPKESPNSFSIHPRDEAGARALGDITDEGIAFVANAVAQSRDHIRDFFAELRAEVAFYIGGLNLHGELAKKGVPLCFPVPCPPTEEAFRFRNLCDVSLALTIPQQAVGNDVDADQRLLVLVTGANQGGKSTFIRSIGLALAMMQSGMFVGATAFCASICTGIYSHYKREESAKLESGKLDEELSRMSDIVDHIEPFSVVLSNESFAATNEREGSEIAFQVMRGLLDNHIRIVCVTHLFALAQRFYEARERSTLSLRADREIDGSRSFKIREGAPLSTSFGPDLYRSVFASRTHTPIGADTKVLIP